MFDDIAFNEEQLINASSQTDRIAVTINNEVEGRVSHKILLCQSHDNQTYSFASDNQNQSKFYFIAEHKFSLGDKEKIMSDLNLMHGSRMHWLKGVPND